jgi:hypothetical protein
VAVLIRQHHTIQQFLFKRAFTLSKFPIQSAFGGNNLMSSKIGRTLTQTLPAAVLLTGLVHFANTWSVSASGAQSTGTSSMAATNQTTFSIDHGGDAEFGDSAITSGDFNRDGQVDVAIANDNFEGVTVRLGLPDFQNDATYPTGAGANEVLTVDFNHDGNLDLAVANAGTNTVSILLGNGDGTFRKINDVLLAGNPKPLPQRISIVTALPILP